MPTQTIKKAGKKIDVKVPEIKKLPISIDVNIGDGDVQVCITTKRQLYRYSMSLYDMQISCGVLQLNNITALNAINRLPRSVTNLISAKNIMLECIKEIVHGMKMEDGDGNESAFILVSNNNEKESTLLNECLDELAESYSTYQRNPNSGNLIRVWILR